MMKTIKMLIMRMLCIVCTARASRTPVSHMDIMVAVLAYHSTNNHVNPIRIDQDMMKTIKMLIMRMLCIVCTARASRTPVSHMDIMVAVLAYHSTNNHVNPIRIDQDMIKTIKMLIMRILCIVCTARASWTPVAHVVIMVAVLAYHRTNNHVNPLRIDQDMIKTIKMLIMRMLCIVCIAQASWTPVAHMDIMVAVLAYHSTINHVNPLRIDQDMMKTIKMLIMRMLCIGCTARASWTPVACLHIVVTV